MTLKALLKVFSESRKAKSRWYSRPTPVIKGFPIHLRLILEYSLKCEIVSSIYFLLKPIFNSHALLRDRRFIGSIISWHIVESFLSFRALHSGHLWESFKVHSVKLKCSRHASFNHAIHMGKLIFGHLCCLQRDVPELFALTKVSRDDYFLTNLSF